MNAKYLMLTAIVMGMVNCLAMPSEKEFATARAVVADVMEPELQAMKDGKKKPGEVADFALSLMGESETAAAKYLLAGRAYGLYIKGGDYAKAVKAMDELQGVIPDMPCDRLLKDITPAAKGVTEKKAPELYARIAELKGMVRSQSEITKLNAALAKAKASEKPDLHRKLGENYAVMNDWKNALEHFVKAGGKVAEIAQCELDDAPADAKIAGFWWDQSEEKGLAKSVASAYRAHAAELYRKGLDAGTISGLNKRVAEQRIEIVGNTVRLDVTAITEKTTRIPKGLAHRWSFNGDLDDSVGGVEANPGGGWKLKDGQCVLDRGWISMSDAAKECRGSFSIEIWTTENARAFGSRIFRLRSKDGKDAEFAWATGVGHEGWFHAANYAVTSGKTDCKDFALGEETYVAMTCKELRDAYDVTAYKYDFKTKKLSSFTATLKKEQLHTIDSVSLGPRIVAHRKFSDSRSSFNEFRIWARCLSKSEIERSAKAGPDKLVL